MKQEQSGVLSKVLMFLAMPFLIFSGTVNNLSFNRELLMLLLITAVIGVVYTFVMFFASKPLVGMEKDQKTNGMMRFCSVFSNNGFLGIPLAISVFGRNSHVFTVLILLNIISNVLMYTLGAYLVTGDRRNIRLKKAFFNPVLIAFLVGLVFNLLRITDRVSEIITFSDHFSNVVTPLSMTILGMKLGAIRFGNLFRSWRIYYVSFLKLIAFPSVILAVLILGRTAQCTIPYDSMILGVFVAFAMPTAGLASTFADEFGGDTENAVIFTLGTTMLSILTIPCLYWILNVFI
jgi:predicted permease